MESPTAEIVSVDGQQALLRVDSPIGCARCAAGKGCGAGLLAGRNTPREFRLPLPSGLTLNQGDRVQLSLLPARLLQATLFVYGLPLAALTLVPLLSNWLWGPLSDAQLAVMAAGGVIVAVLVGRRLLARDRCLEQLVPEITGRAVAQDQ